MVDYMKRTSVKNQLFTKIVEEVAKSNGRPEWGVDEGRCRDLPGHAGRDSNLVRHLRLAVPADLQPSSKLSGTRKYETKHPRRTSSI